MQRHHKHLYQEAILELVQFVEVHGSRLAQAGSAVVPSRPNVVGVLRRDRVVSHYPSRDHVGMRRFY